MGTCLIADPGRAVLTGVIAVLGAVGWALWFLVRQDMKAARNEARSATERARLSEAQAAAARACEASALCTAQAAEAQARVANVENRSLRRSLADARGKVPNGESEVKPDDLFDSTTGRLRVYTGRRDGEGE